MLNLNDPKRFEDAFDKHGILKDGKGIRVAMRDHATVKRFAADGTNTRGHQPGWRIPIPDSGVDQQDKRTEAYASYHDELVNSWHTPITGVGEHGTVGQREGDLCTRDGRAGVLRANSDGQLFCDTTRKRADGVSEGNDLVCPSCAGSGADEDGEDCETCHGEGVVSFDYEDNRSVGQIAAEHRQTMNKLYGDRDRALTEQWKNK